VWFPVFPCCTCRKHQRQQQQPAEICNAPASSNGVHSSSSSSDSVIRQTLELPPLPAEAAELDPEALSEASILDRQLEKALLAASSGLYEQMVGVHVAAQQAGCVVECHIICRGSTAYGACHVSVSVC
jgi:hypothetical protein